MKITIFATLILSCFTAICFSQTTRITGTAGDAAGLSVSLNSYADLISFRETILAQTEIGRDQTFSLELTHDKTLFAWLQIGIQKAEIILEPGKEYNISLSGLLGKEIRNQEIAPFQIPPLSLEINHPWRFELNGLVNDFNRFYDNFIAENYSTIIRQRDKTTVEGFVREVYSRFPGIDNAWFNTMLTYQTGQLEIMARSRGREVIAGDYLKGKEILYDHFVYMEFFTQYFEKYLIASRMYDRNELEEILRSGQPYPQMMKLLSKDPVLEDHRLRELVLLKGLFDLYVTPGFDRNNILNLLEYIQANGAFEEHRMIAGNLISSLR